MLFGCGHILTGNLGFVKLLRIEKPRPGHTNRFLFSLFMAAQFLPFFSAVFMFVHTVQQKSHPRVGVSTPCFREQIGHRLTAGFTRPKFGTAGVLLFAGNYRCRSAEYSATMPVAFFRNQR